MQIKGRLTALLMNALGILEISNFNNANLILKIHHNIIAQV